MRHLSTFLASYLLATVSLIPLSTSAQVVPDNTLPNNTIVTPDGKTVEIGGGTAAGDNLFHSFEQFSILVGETAFFDNAATIENIISRVTGDAVSNIEGLIRANGEANLFLINPNGIIFGENASLDIGGSFVSSTADSIKFADGREFSATAPTNAEPLLTVSIPVGLQYGNDTGDITVRGTGNNLSIDPDTFTVNRSDRPQGLKVDEDRTLALVGGNVFLPGGNLTAAGGKVEIGSVDGTGLVKLTPDGSGWNLNYDEAVDFQEISLTDAASIEVSGNGGGNVRLQGSIIGIADGSAILADTLGDGWGGNLEITATEATEIVGTSADNYFPTRLSTDVDLGATGNGGNLSIASDYLLVTEGAQINSGTFGLGDAGNLTVEATEVEVIGESDDGEFASGLFAQADFGETGDGGDLSIATNYLLVADGAQISTTTFGIGDAGDLNIAASEIELIAASGEFASGLFVSTEAEGNSGSLNIETDYLLVADGAAMVTSTFGSGDAGNMNVTASEIELIGGAAEVGPSGLFADVEAGSSGSGGNLTVETTSLSITDGAQIAALTRSIGNAGTVNIDVERVNLDGTSPGGTPSGLFANAEEGSSGNGGNLLVNATSLSITNGGQIATSTLSSGNGGDLQIVASEFILLEGTTDRSGGLFANALADDGSGGNIDITTGLLEVSEGATVSVSNFPSSDNSPFSPGQGAAGNLEIVASEILLDERGSITADTFTGDRGNINLQSDLLILRRASQISTNAQETATGGNITIDVSDGFLVAVPQENSDITANAVFGDGGRVDISAAEIFGIQPRESLTSWSDITASSEFGIAGSVILQTQDLNPTEDSAALPDTLNAPQLAQGCQIGTTNNSSFINIGRGGLNPQPDTALGGDTLIGDVQLPRQWSENNGIVEAKTWTVNDRGKIILVADSPPPSILSRCQLN